MLVLDDAFDRSAGEHLPADAADENLVSVREGLLQQ
jgi:hypothetical protein